MRRAERSAGTSARLLSKLSIALLTTEITETADLHPSAGFGLKHFTGL